MSELGTRKINTFICIFEIWIDGRYDTSPYGLLGGLAVGFGSFVVRLVRMGARLQALDDEGGDADRMDEKSP